MTLELNDSIIHQTGLNAHQVLIELAVHLYEMGMITVGQGGELTHLGHVGFQHELGRRNIFLHFDVVDWEKDQDALRKLGLI